MRTWEVGLFPVLIWKKGGFYDHKCVGRGMANQCAHNQWLLINATDDDVRNLRIGEAISSQHHKHAQRVSLSNI
jgi:hypothetical protein